MLKYNAEYKPHSSGLHFVRKPVMSQTKKRGTNKDEYQIYLSCADNGEGIDITTGEPMKTYEEWMGR